MASPIKTFLEAQAARLAALTHDYGEGAGAETLFPRVWIVPDVDDQALINDARFPTALVQDEGGTRHADNYAIDQRTFAVTIVIETNRDGLHEFATKEMLELIDKVEQGDGSHPGLIYDTENSVRSMGDSATVMRVYENGLVLVMKKLVFGYELLRS